MFFQFVRNDSALDAGVRLLPFVIFLVVVCVANGAIMSITGYYFREFIQPESLTATLIPNLFSLVRFWRSLRINWEFALIHGKQRYEYSKGLRLQYSASRWRRSFRSSLILCCSGEGREARNTTGNRLHHGCTNYWGHDRIG